MKILSHTKLAISQAKKYFRLGPKQSHLEYSGPYPTWKDAVDNSVGYASSVVLAKVSEATKKVLLGEAVFERDGTVFHDGRTESSLSRNLVPLLEREAKIIDFGGGLGGLFLDHREIFQSKQIEYVVLEQENFVSVGRDFAGQFQLPIKFESDLTPEVLAGTDILVLSGVIQYLEKYKETISELISQNVRYILIDRTPLVVSPTEIFVQENDGYYVPKVSYPSRKINRFELLDCFPNYLIKAEWESDFDPSDHLGFLLESRTQNSKNWSD